jgi:hypothetical protein
VTSADPPTAGPPIEGGRLRVATIPSADPYVDAVLPEDVVRVGPGGNPSPWLDAAYLEAHATEIDVLHLHTGDRRVAEAAGQCWSETVRRAGLPLVVTVHRVHDPAQATDAGPTTAGDDHLEAVLATAEVVLTPTPGAADAIAERFGRTAIVVAHPSMAVPDPELGSERGLVGLPFGPSTAGVADEAALVRAALSGAVSGGGRLRVLVEAGASASDGVRELALRGELQLVEHSREEWPAQLQQLHVAVLPERCGTHSRDLEICRDVGTRVVAPSCGWFADQWSEVVSYGDDEQGALDPVSLSAAVSVALTRPMLLPADRAWRAQQLAAVRRVHGDVYAQVAGDRAWA